ncbi:hypothetical protein [Oricola indica]|uniref:hypothetical protein n=1 Tax=Oricola indica TaxID=2872591 RepID=UPI003CCB8B9E
MRVALAIVMALFSLGAAAEERCWMGSASFSPGVTVRAGNSIMVCTPESSWQNTDTWAAGCFSDGKFFSVGAMQSTDTQPPVILQCNQDGTWQQWN